jgi:invasion protein IalB
MSALDHECLSRHRAGSPGGRILAALALATLTVATLTVATATAQQPAAPEAAPGQPPPAEQQIALIYTPWTKYCLRAPDTRQTCFIGKDGRLGSGEVVIAAVIVEPGGDATRVLRVTVPLRVQLVQGTRVSIDNNLPRQAPYVICLNNGCISDYEATAEMMANLKQGQNLIVQAIDENGLPVGLPLPLREPGGGFAKAYDGEAVDPIVTDDNYKQLNQALRQRSDEARQNQAASVPAAAGAAAKQN